MSKLIEQIQFFHVLKLQPIFNKELERWEREIEKNLIAINNLKESYVLINKINEPCERILRVRRKKRCCKMCEENYMQ